MLKREMFLVCLQISSQNKMFWGFLTTKTMFFFIIENYICGRDLIHLKNQIKSPLTSTFNLFTTIKIHQ